ncbi:MAG: hypothetical protein H7143_14180, partial [Pseudorhodobacter sp.]|nr:hypothetical protein [Rhizobacter sp.]
YGVWALLGASMAMTLYEPAFNVLTKRFPDRYVRGITTLTLVGGFASTLSFPAAAWMLSHWGWRGAAVAIGVVFEPDAVGHPARTLALNQHFRKPS